STTARRADLGVAPFLVDDGVDQGVPPTSLVPLVLAEVSFAPHPEFLEHVRRRRVVSDALGPDAVQTEFSEPEVENGASGLGRVPPSPGVRIQLVADVALALFGVVDPHTTVADQPPVPLADDRQLPDPARLLRLRGDELADEIADGLRDVRD